MSDQREAVAAALHRRGEGGKETWGRAVEDQAPGTWGLVDYYREWADEIMEALTPDCGVETPEAAVEYVEEGWWHPNVKSGQVHDHPERPGGSWSVASHRLCEPVYTKRRAQGWTPPGTDGATVVPPRPGASRVQ